MKDGSQDILGGKSVVSSLRQFGIGESCWEIGPASRNLR